MLYLVATPIGNLGDITARALDTLRAANVIAAEDTRVTRKLLSHFQIKTPLISYHEHSGPAATYALVRRMVENGDAVALVTDAGTPGISDPGAELVAASIAAGVNVVPIPGPAAFVSALVASGLPSARFLFEGFLPRTRSTRLQRLSALKLEPRTVIFYESPHRVGATVKEIAQVFGAERRGCVAREITKLFEEFRRGRLGELADYYSGQTVRGECVVIVEGATEQDISDHAAASFDLSHGECASESETSPAHGKDLIRLLAVEIGIPRRELYQLVLQLKNQQG
jgi:16S rRNA (cytidine1402-2'-O)-methyltransferase